MVIATAVRGSDKMTATQTDASITIRPAREDDHGALRRLAQLDAGPVPSGDVLIAEVDGVPRAAMRILDRTYVADPFYPSRELVRLLDVRASRLAAERHTHGARGRARLAGWTALWRRASVSHPAQ
jgi:hypothetical protein